MLEYGYIQLYRSILDWEWYHDMTTKSVFLHLLLTANYEPQKWRGMVVERGQRVFSRVRLAQELKISEKSLRVALEHLKKTGEVAIQSTPQYSIATIKNYDRYQIGASPAANEGPTEGQRGANEGPQCNKDNKANKEKEENSGCAASPSGLPEGFVSEEEYIAYLRR